MSIGISWLKNKLKQKFYPVTHAKAVLYGEDSYTTLDKKIKDLEGGTIDNTNKLGGKDASEYALKEDLTKASDDAKSYTDNRIDEIVGEGASETLDTIGEISKAFEEHQEVTEAINEAIGKKANATDLTEHTGNKSNPHGVTKIQVGLGNVPNVATNDQTPTFTVASANAELISGEKLSVAFGKIAKAIKSLIAHLKDDKSHIPTPQTANEKTFLRNDNTWQEVTPANIGAAPSSHEQSASTISAGTFKGKVVGNATAVATLSDKQFRNIYVGTSTLTSGSSSLPTGDIYMQYE